MPQNMAAALLYIMRRTRGLFQRGLANKVGLSNTAVSDAEGGVASAETWVKLAVYFRFTTDAWLWLAGIISPIVPPKREIVDRINRIVDEMEPEVREKAELLIEWVNNEK